MIKFLVLSCLVLVPACANCQFLLEPAGILKNISRNYEQNFKVALSYVYTFPEEISDQNESHEAVLVYTPAYYYAKIAEVETYSSSKYQLMADHANKLIKFTRYENSTPPELPAVFNDSIFTRLNSSYKIKQEIQGKMGILSFLPESAGEDIIMIKYHISDFTINKIRYVYKAEEFDAEAYMDIIFSKYENNITPDVQHDLVQKYLNLDENKVNLKKPFDTYQLFTFNL